MLLVVPVVPVDLLEPLVVSLAFVLLHVVHILDHPVLDGLPQGIAVEHVGEIFVFHVGGARKAQHIPKAEFLA